jgi:hypothetical protein
LLAIRDVHSPGDTSSDRVNTRKLLPESERLMIAVFSEGNALDEGRSKGSNS